MPDFVHLRHKPVVELAEPRPLIVALPPMQSNINISRIVRAASCCGVRRMVVCGHAKIDRKIARDGADEITIEVRRTLPPVLKQFREEGYRLVGLEQTTNSQCLYDYRYESRSVLVIGHERQGLTEDVLQLLDDVIEIPVYGLPHAHNAATAAAIALYEYCRQHRDS